MVLKAPWSCIWALTKRAAQNSWMILGSWTTHQWEDHPRCQGNPCRLRHLVSDFQSVSLKLITHFLQTVISVFQRIFEFNLDIEAFYEKKKKLNVRRSTVGIKIFHKTSRFSKIYLSLGKVLEMEEDTYKMGRNLATFSPFHAHFIFPHIFFTN